MAAATCAIESLERRVLFSTVTVNTLLDDTTIDSLMSLREAVSLIQNGGDDTAAIGRSLTTGEQAQIDTTEPYGTNDTIVFDSSLAGQTISLGSELAISGTMTIDAGKAGLTLDGGYGGWRAFNISSGGALTLSHLTITHFRQTFSGGAISVYQGLLTVDHCLITSNSVSSFSYGGFGSTPAYGGAIYANGSYVIISDSTISSNSASGSSSIGSSSYATGGSAQGGAIWMSNGELDINRSTFSSNTASGGSAYSYGYGYGYAYGGSGTGGAIAALSAELHIIDSTLTANSATGGYASGGTSHTSGTGVGGAIYASVDDVTIDFSTLSANTAANGGRDLHYDSATGQTLLMHNSILGQSDNTGADFVVSNGTPLLYGSNNLIRSTTVTGIGNLSTADPKLGALADNGGPTQTMALQNGSPALNAGIGTGVSVDQRGAFRTNGSAADIGALETFADAIVTPPAFVSAALATATQGSAFTFTITATGAPTAVLSKTGTLPSGVTFTNHGDGTATLAGTPGATGNFAFSLTADNGDSPAVTQSFVLSVVQTPAFVSVDHATFTVGAAGSFTFNTSAFPAATVSEVGALPTGVTFTNNGDGTATLAGTPGTGTAGDFALAMTAANGHSPDATQAFVLTVVQAPAFVTANHASFVVGTAGSFTFSTTGSPTAALTQTGALPSGVTFTDNGDGTATLAGTPGGGTAGDFALDVTADTGQSPPVSQTFTLSVLQVPAFVSVNHATFAAGTPGSFTITTTGSPDAAITETGALPSGLTLTDNGDGTATLAGTALDGDGGDHPLTLSASNGTTPATQAFTITITTISPTPVVISADDGSGDTVVTNSDGTVRFTITDPFTTHDATRVTSGDVTGDGVSDIILAAGAGGHSMINLYDGDDGTLVHSFAAFSRSFDGTLYVTSADVNHDGVADLIVGKGRDGDSKTSFKVFDGTNFSLMASVKAFGSSGDARVAAADLDGDGFADVVVTQGAGESTTRARVFSGADLAAGHGTVLSTITPFGTSYKGGAFVATGDVNNDGQTDIILSKKGKLVATVSVFSGADGSQLSTFDTASTTGGTLASHDTNQDGFSDILVGVSDSTGKHVRIFSGLDNSLLDTIDLDASAGLFVA